MTSLKTLFPNKSYFESTNVSFPSPLEKGTIQSIILKSQTVSPEPMKTELDPAARSTVRKQKEGRWTLAAELTRVLRLDDKCRCG